MEKRKLMHSHLLLLEDVEDLGRSGDLVRVKPGYARNYLIPHGKAVVADNNALRIQGRLAEERARKAAVDREIAETIAARAGGVTLAIEVKVDHEGHMYGSVAAADIVQLFADQGIEIERKSVVLRTPIKKLGAHDLTLKLNEGVTCNYRVKVTGEGWVEPEPEPEVEEAVVEESAEAEEEVATEES